MTVDTNELRELAEAATPGPWGIVGIDDLPEINDLMIVSDAVLGDGEPAWITNIGGAFSQVYGAGMEPSQDERNARYIAAANPTTILSLLDRLAAMTERAEKAERERDARPNLDESDCAALLGALAGDVVQPDLGWFGRITDELAACRKRGSR